MRRFLKLLIFIIFLGNEGVFGKDEVALSSPDVIGSSSACAGVEAQKKYNEESCYRDSELHKQQFEARNARLKILGQSEKQIASSEIKKRLIENAITTMEQSIAEAIQMTGQNPLSSPVLRNSIEQVKNSCAILGQGTQNILSHFFDSAKASEAAIPSKLTSTLEKKTKKLIIASIELNRINRMIQDNYVHGEEKEKLLQRRQMIQILYPLAGGSNFLSLRQQIDKNLKKSFSQSLSREAGPPWINDYLFSDKEIPENAMAMGSFSHEMAISLSKTPLDSALIREANGLFTGAFNNHFQSIRNLCSADPCSTFNVSHRLTANSLERRRLIENANLMSTGDKDSIQAAKLKFTALQREICACNLLTPPETMNKIFKSNLEIATVGSLAVCMTGLAAPVACTSALIGGVVTGVGSVIQGSANLMDALSTQPAIEASKNLPGLESSEKIKLQNYQKSQIKETAENSALAVGSGAVISKTLPVAVKAIGAVKDKIGTKIGLGKKEDIRLTERRTASDSQVTEATELSNSRVDSRQSFSGEWSKKSGTTEVERQKYDSLHKEIEAKQKKGQAIPVVYRSIENSIQKILNSKFGDFAFIDAINNRRDAIIREKILNLQKKYPDLKLEFSSDWKGLHTIAHGKIPETYADEFGAIINSSYKQLTQELISKGMIRASDEKMILDDMNHSGYGPSFDSAVAARKLDKNSRGELSANEGRGGRSLEDPLIQENHQTQFKQTELLRSELEESIGRTSLMRMDIESGKLVPARELYSVVKLSDDPKAIANIIKNRWGVELNESVVARLQEYTKLLNDQSPSLLPSVKRETASLSKAQYGGISSDTVGMNTFNLDATAKGAARATDHMDSLTTIRSEEQKVTHWLDTQVNVEYREIAGQTVRSNNVPISGDEKKALFPKAGLLTQIQSKIFNRPAKEEELKKFVMAHAQENPSLQRHTYIGPNVPTAQRDIMTEHGHSIQKKMWEILEMDKTLSYQKLQNINGMILMETQKLNTGNVSIIIGKKPGTGQFTASEKAGIQKALDEAIKYFNPATKDKDLSSYQIRRIIFADE